MLEKSSFYTYSDDDGNPLVSGFQEDLESEDELEPVQTSYNNSRKPEVEPAKTGKIKDVQISSDEDDNNGKWYSSNLTH